MRIVGDRVSKIEATRDEVLERPLKIKTDVNIINISKKDLYGANDMKKGIALDYDFKVTYGNTPCAKIVIKGSVFAMGEKKEMDELVKSWDKDKKQAMGLTLPFLNRAMELGYLAAIPVAKELSLPTPLKLPKFVAEPIKKENKDESG